MAPIVMWTVVAFVVATGVLLVVIVAGGRSGGLRGFFADLRPGPSRGEDADHVEQRGMLADTRRELADAADAGSSSVDQIFDIGEPQEVAYLGTNDHPRR